MTVDSKVLLILMDERMVRIHAMAERKVENWVLLIMKEAMKVLQIM